MTAEEILGHRVVLRPWTYGAKQRALREATTWRREGETLVPDVDPWRLNDLMVVGCVEEWDLVDGEGEPLPITVESLHGLQPGFVEALIRRCQELNGVSVDERKK